MDSLTQIVLGAAVGEACLGKKVGNKAILWGAIAGTIPDLDVLTSNFVDIVTANEIHRGFSHSILFCLIAAPVFGWLLHTIYPRSEATRKDWTILMFLGLFTHPILDAFTTWGTQLFWPFDYKVSFKNIFVVDPLYTLPFLLCILILMFYKRTSPTRRRLNNLGLIISSSYILLTLGLKWFTYTKFEKSLHDQKIPFIAIQNKPTPLNTILWTANVETEDAFLIGFYSLLDDDDSIQYSKFPKNHQLLGDMASDPLIHRLIALTEGWYTIEKKESHIYFNDLRFGQLGVVPKANNFVFSYELFYENGMLQAKEKEKDVRDISPLLSQLWSRINGIKP
ncbi:metal-dependent hydrolase [Aquimarina sp. TRL1]|uniref:metal-dependent hydrolase n=1 Tax=Aquimarina sp. (strain TRL1) TaxID=2736252 RepID=UPI00158E5E21|nr:metal-dependent hydrolase [Aquimarina sp. TRL1]QKX07272.1 metal-dependent hydrolase [Aquimarina sp. TRL1]